MPNQRDDRWPPRRECGEAAPANTAHRRPGGRDWRRQPTRQASTIKQGARSARNSGHRAITTFGAEGLQQLRDEVAEEAVHRRWRNCCVRRQVRAA